jgi:hypothetical protein
LRPQGRTGFSWEPSQLGTRAIGARVVAVSLDQQIFDT